MAEKNAPASPESLQLRAAPLTSARLSTKAALSAVAVLAVILGVIITNVSKDNNAKKSSQQSTREVEPALNAARALTRDVPDVIADPPPALREPLPAAAPPPVASAPPQKNTDEDARLAETAVSKFDGAQGNPTPGKVQYSAMPRAVDAFSESAPQESKAASGSEGNAATDIARPSAPFGAEIDPNHQSEKLAFTRNSSKSTTLQERLQPPASPFELTTGTVIPGIVINSISTDLPGELLGQVSRNVYDSATGRYLLIPQGSRLYGRYDSQVSFGQQRTLVVWYRLIFPNAYTLELEGMGGYDEQGRAGFKDRVNQHYGRIFGWGLLTSVLSAGLQLSQPQQANSLVPSNGQVAAAAVGQQMADLGVQIASRNMQVQPTLEIRNGYPFNVMVNKDIVFPGTYSP